MHSRKFLLLLIAALLLLLAACDDTTSPLEPDPPITLAADAAPYIIDTDMTTDDWIAITILLNHPHADVRAITVSGTGVARCDAGVQNALDLAALAGRPDIPVTCGRETPMEGDHAFPDAWRDASATLAGVSVPDNPNPPADMTAVELLIQTIHEADQPVTLVTLGPLTNVAEAFEADPTIIQNISMIWTMGGAMDVPGDISEADTGISNPTAEWNIYADPHAAKIVIESQEAPLTLVAVDATNLVPVTSDFVAEMRRPANRQTQSAEFVYRVLHANVGWIQSGGFYFWDPLAASLSIDSTLAAYAQYAIVVIEEGAQSGTTLADVDGRPRMVANFAYREQFEAFILAVLNRRQP